MGMPYGLAAFVFVMAAFVATDSLLDVIELLIRYGVI